MPKKLDNLIAQVVIEAGTDDGCSAIPCELVAAATRAAPAVTAEDVAKFPALWYPTISAKGAGAPKLKEGWGRMWFEALMEVLYQASPIGLPALLELWERDLKTYHGLVAVRLFRLAAGGVQKKQILDKVKARFPQLNHPAGTECVEEVLLWA